eukprot:scaffold80673_cov67-Phaeocystis_antarctica.AAC.2
MRPPTRRRSTQSGRCATFALGGALRHPPSGPLSRRRSVGVASRRCTRRRRRTRWRRPSSWPTIGPSRRDSECSRSDSPRDAA